MTLGLSNVYRGQISGYNQGRKLKRNGQWVWKKTRRVWYPGSQGIKGFGEEGVSRCVRWS